MDVLINAVPAVLSEANLHGLNLLSPILAPMLTLTAAATFLLARDAIRPGLDVGRQQQPG